MKFLRMISDFLLTPQYGAPVFKIVVFWFFGLLVFGSVMQSAQNNLRAEMAIREAGIIAGETKLRLEREALEKERAELQAWNKAITEKAKEVEVDKKLKKFKEEIEDYVDPPAR